MVTIVEYLSSAIKGKPLDASDVATYEDARAELMRLRRVAYRVCDILNKTNVGAGQDSGADEEAESEKKEKKKHRQALKEDDAFKNYKKVTVPKSFDDRELIKSSIMKNPLFSGTSESGLGEFVDVFSKKVFTKGSTVIQQGDNGETFYVVDSGALDIFINAGEGKNQNEMRVGVPYGRGNAFGELALIYGSPRAATIRASENCVLWEITRTAFKGIQLQNEQKSHNLKLSELRKVRIGEQLLGDVMSASQLESMALATHPQSFERGHVIVREGEKGDVFYIITHGEVDVFKRSVGFAKICSLGAHSFFGERALLGSDTRQATCVASDDVQCLTLTREDFTLMLGNLEDLLSGKVAPVAEKKNASRPSTSAVSKTNFSIADLEVKGVLGEGAFGKVSLVKAKKDGKLYALKAQGKAFVVENGQQEHLLMEYQLMKELDHAFIVNCHQAFQDKKFVYFLMNLLPGGELMDLLDKHRHFPEAWTRFYGATVVTAFQAMHEKKIAYRDLKPENLVLDADGYCYVVDMGLAKKCDKGKTWTFCGTPDYLAPEIIRGKGHDWAVDYWELGVLLYELTHGYPPFYADDPTNTARKIIKGTYPVPPRFSKPFVDIISRLLKDQSKRLGRTKGGINEIMEHQWFSGFDWAALMERKMEVPSKPKLGDLESLGRKENSKERIPDSSWNPVFD